MSDPKAKEEDIAITEESDGSATVELPENLAPKQAEDNDEQLADGGEAVADDDQDHPDDTEAVRSARRARRKAKKELIKRTNEEKDRRLELLQRQNNELMERLAVIERKTHSSDLAKLDKAIEDEELRLQYAMAKMREAGDNSNGTELAKAQELWYETRGRVDALKRAKEEAAKSQVNEGGAVNPKLQRYASDWMENNPWYDPSGTDEDSEIAKMIDQRLHKEGWDPTTEEYWEELDNRLQKRLPHRYNQSQDEPRRKPRSFVTGSGRESAPSRGAGQFVLSPDQVRAMKDAGFWDNPEKRARMIKRYAQEARNQRS
jgi:hypothetical protein